MTDQPLPTSPEAQFQEFKKDVLRRLERLELSPRATNTSVRNGSMTYLDDLGNVLLELTVDGLNLYDLDEQVRAILGDLDGNGNFGVVVRSENGSAHFRVDNQGMKAPWLGYPWRDPYTTYSFDETSFTALFRSRMALVNHGAVEAEIGFSVPAGTTGEVRLGVNGSNYSNPVELPEDENTVVRFRWIHGVTLGSGPANFALEARVVSGVGPITYYQPEGALYGINVNAGSESGT